MGREERGKERRSKDEGLQAFGIFFDGYGNGSPGWSWTIMAGGAVVLRGALASGAAATRLGSCENGHESPFRHCTDVWASGQIKTVSDQRLEAVSIRFGAQPQAGKIRKACLRGLLCTA